MIECSTKGCQQPVPSGIQEWNRCGQHYLEWEAHLKPKGRWPLKEHGTLNAYNNLLCRCSECRAANAKNQRTRQAAIGIGRRTVKMDYDKLYDKLQKHAEENGMSVRAVVRKALKAYL